MPVPETTSNKVGHDARIEMSRETFAWFMEGALRKHAALQYRQDGRRVEVRVMEGISDTAKVVGVTVNGKTGAVTIDVAEHIVPPQPPGSGWRGPWDFTLKIGSHFDDYRWGVTGYDRADAEQAAAHAGSYAEAKKIMEDAGFPVEEDRKAGAEMNYLGILSEMARASKAVFPPRNPTPFEADFAAECANYRSLPDDYLTPAYTPNQLRQMLPDDDGPQPAFVDAK